MKSSIPEDAEHWPWSSRAIRHVHAVIKGTDRICCIFFFILCLQITCIHKSLTSNSRGHIRMCCPYSWFTQAWLTLLSLFVWVNSNREIYKVVFCGAVISSNTSCVYIYIWNEKTKEAGNYNTIWQEKLFSLFFNTKMLSSHLKVAEA